MNIIEINDLCKYYGELCAVDHISFTVTEGDLFAFLGVNGAGKSTTISILCGQLSKNSGEVRICDTPIDGNMAELTRSLGVVFQNSVLDSALTVEENLESRAALYGMTRPQFRKRLSELAAMLDFDGLQKRTVGKLSGGQRRRIDIARALLHHPKILILDEPTTGLDPQTRKLLWDVISDLRKTEQLTVFLTTHYMEEAAEADQVVILDRGRIVAKGTPIELKNQYTGDFVSLYQVEEAAVQRLNLPYAPLPGGFRLQLPNTKAATELILKHPHLFADYEIVKGKMDDVFLAVTGKDLRQATQEESKGGKQK